MIKLLHCADLHLSEAEKEYSLSVLKEIADKAKSENVDYLLFCGDVFDTYQDLQKMQQHFCWMLSDLNNCKIFFLPGNHEELGCSDPELDKFSWRNVELMAAKPFSFTKCGEGEDQIEFLAVPHQKQYEGYLDWPVPKKMTKYRIALAHGFVSGMSFTGLDEEGGMTLDPGMFKEYKVDYVALGHVHKGETNRFEGIPFCYPGSSRVVSRGEALERKVSLVQIDGQIKTDMLTLSNAGEYREYAVPLPLDGDIKDKDIERMAYNWNKLDRICLKLTGVVGDKNKVERRANEIKQAYEGIKVRELEFTTKDVLPEPRILGHPFAVRFLELWESKKDEEEADVWSMARELVLNQVAAELQKSKR